MIKYDDVLSVQYLKTQVFTGSDTGMRYRLWHDEDNIKCCHWPEPLGFAASDPETQVTKEFPYNEEGRCKAIDWLNEEHKKYQ